MIVTRTVVDSKSFKCRFFNWVFQREVFVLYGPDFFQRERLVSNYVQEIVPL